MSFKTDFASPARLTYALYTFLHNNPLSIPRHGSGAENIRSRKKGKHQPLYQ